MKAQEEAGHVRADTVAGVTRDAGGGREAVLITSLLLPCCHRCPEQMNPLSPKHTGLPPGGWKSHSRAENETSEFKFPFCCVTLKCCSRNICTWERTLGS